MQTASRRAVLAGAGAGLAVAALAPAHAAAAPAPAVPQRSQFNALRGRTVALRGPAGVVRARVVDVADLTGRPADDPLAYSVVLRPASPLPDGLYRVTGTGLTSATLFLGNVGVKRSNLELVVRCSAH